jgi:acetylornithine deacetylase
LESHFFSTVEESVLAHLDQKEDQLVDLLTRFVHYQTVTPGDGQGAQTEDFQEFIKFVGEFLNQIGINQQEIWEQDASKLETGSGLGVNPARDLSNMPILAATLPGVGGGKSIILNGHYDVVPSGDLATWNYNPFKAEIVDGKIFGRGTNDMKGGIAAMLIAVQALRELDIRLQGDLIVQIVPDEEMTCMGTLSCCQRGYKADAALIPEPTDMDVLIAMRGSFYGEIVVRGRAGHAEITQPHWKEGGAVNAIGKAQIVLAALDELNQQWQVDPDQQHDLLDPDVCVPTGISGGDWGVTYPDKVTISFGVMTTSTKEVVQKKIEAHMIDYLQKDSWLMAHPPEFIYEPDWLHGAEISADQPIVQEGLEALRQLGYETKVAGMGSLTDAIHLIKYLGIPTISIGPDGQTAHMVDEYAEIGQLVDTAKAIALILLRWCGVEDKQ